MNATNRQMVTDTIRDLSAAIAGKNTSEFDKIANKFSDILAIESYMYGAARQIYGALRDGKFDKLTAADTDKIKIENENERLRVELPVAPDIEQFTGDTQPRKLRGEGYLETGRGRFVSGYFTTLKTPIIEKHVDLIEVYPYDFVEEIKKSRHLSIYKKEDIFWFYGSYSLISDVEALLPGASIMTTNETTWDSTPHYSVIDLMKLHGNPAKKNQPRELIVMPEENYLDFGKVNDSVIRNISEKFLNEGFSKDDTPLYMLKKLLLRDARGLTFAPHSPDHTLFNLNGANAFQKELATLKFFGYNVTDPVTGVDAATRVALGLILASRYGVTYDANPNDTVPSRSTFQRILVYSPINYLGRVYQWQRDIRNHIKVENDVVSTYSDSKVTFMFHNKFAVTALDIWS